ncbi:MAG TPA: zf-HC2 domain-containing protein [Pyrinomonadaceae bacterium]|jgi:anti-sigma factor RsiW
MRNPCLDEGILQSYYDGELAPERLEHVASHLAACAACAEMARTVESEIELATAAFSAELSLPVPTERVRARLDEAIKGMQPQPALISKGAASRVRAWFSTLAASFNLTPQRAVGFASLAVFFVLAAVVGGIMMRQRESGKGFVAANANQRNLSDLNFNGSLTPEIAPAQAIEKHRVVVHKQTAKVKQSSVPAPDLNQLAEAAPPRVLPGEKNYLQAIAVLANTIEANGESTLKPTLLSDYKRNLAVVDNAITVTQRTARTNPQSSDAAEMLYSAYQSKLELLSAVAEQSHPFIQHR